MACSRAPARPAQPCAARAYTTCSCVRPIRATAKLKEAPAHQKTIFEWAADSNAAHDYDDVVDQVWGDGATGPYYGMPWLNLFGWYITGVALMIVLEWRRADVWLDRIRIEWLAGFYAANLALSLGICAAAGLSVAVIASLVPILACVLALRGHRAEAGVARVTVSAQ